MNIYIYIYTSNSYDHPGVQAPAGRLHAREEGRSVCVYIYIYIYDCVMHTYMFHIYIYIYREREIHI